MLLQACARHAGCVIHKNPYREMMEEEAAAKVDATAPENAAKGQWFSNPQPGAVHTVAQKPAPNGTGAVPMIGSQLPPSKKDDKSKNKRKEPEVDGFDAW